MLPFSKEPGLTAEDYHPYQCSTEELETCRVRVSIYDYTRGAEVGGSKVWETTVTNGNEAKPSSTLKGVVGLYLEAGHTYALRFGTAVASSQSGSPSWMSFADMGSTDHREYGVDVSSVVIDFK